jgi:3-dehydroquinate synthase
VAARSLTLRYPGQAATSRVLVEPGGLDRLGARVKAQGVRHAVVVSEPCVAALYARRALASLERRGIGASLVCVPTGERAKTPRHVERLWGQFASLGLDRGDVVIALGGGAVGDVAGFAAATWLRGIAWVGVPTSLLAQVDSSVGGKTAVDLPAGKNLCGAFHQPALVVVDPAVLATLPLRHVRSGLAEVVKMGMAVDARLLRQVERHVEALLARDSEVLADAALRSLRAKARITQSDEREREGGRRTALNLGHTLGHALEACLGYRRLIHGEAVAIGLRVAARLSVELAGLEPEARLRQDDLLDRLGLPSKIPGVRLGALMDAMGRDKKGRNGKIRWVLTPRVGHASVPRLVPSRRVEAALIEAGARR